MVGRRDKQPAQQQADGEVIQHGGNTFRRKLSYGLSFLSKPLSQKGPTSHQARKPSLLASQSDTSRNPSPLLDDGANDSLLSNTTVPECSDDSSAQPVRSYTPQNPTSIFDPETTPKPLPRSQTLSLIPRPVKSELDSTSAGAVQAHRSLFTAARAENSVPCKIPTPSPPLSERRFSSPRQYLPQQCSQHLRPTATGNKAGKPGEITPRVAVRSRTAPNLAQTPSSLGSIRKIEPKISRLTETERSNMAPVSRGKLLQENIPTQPRGTPRARLAQEKTLKPESLAMPGVVPYKKPLRPTTPLSQRTKSSIVTPTKTRKQLGTSGRQITPVTAKRLHSSERIGFHPPTLSRTLPDNTRGQPRFTHSRSNLSPILDINIPSPPRVDGERENQRKTLGTPNGLGGVWRSSRALAATNHEVSKLPRSHTFHRFPELPPPVPPIPEKYKSFSLSNLKQAPSSDRPGPPQPRLPFHDSGREITTEATEERHRDLSLGFIPRPISTSSILIPRRSTYTKEPKPTSPIGSTRQLSSSQGHMRQDGEDCDRPQRPNGRSWSISDFYFPESAHVDSFLQVKDYMPYLYWAGRFQSRLDQWRTEAVLAELNPSHMPTGPLSQFELSQDKLAACHIFGQLRDLCTSNQAADSLWVR